MSLLLCLLPRRLGPLSVSRFLVLDRFCSCPRVLYLHSAVLHQIQQPTSSHRPPGEHGGRRCHISRTGSIVKQLVSLSRQEL